MKSYACKALCLHIDSAGISDCGREVAAENDSRTCSFSHRLYFLRNIQIKGLIIVHFYRLRVNN